MVGDRLELWRARRQGRADGKRGIPDAGNQDTFPPGLLAVRQRADRRLADIVRRWAREDQRLKGRYCALKLKIEAATRAIEEVNRRAREYAESHESRRTEIASMMQNRRGRGWGLEHEWHLNKWIYRVALALIIIGEIPLNSIAFRLFGEPEITTWVMTIGLAATLVGCAHGLGILLRLDRRTDVQRVWVGVLIAFPALVIGVVSLIRSVYLAAFGAGFLGPFWGTVSFALINAIIYVAATLLSYMRHDASTRELPDTGRPLGRELRKEQGRLAKLRQEIERVRAVRESNWEMLRTELLSAHNWYELLMNTYVAANVRARWDQATPPVLRKLPQIEAASRPVPALSWDCDADALPLRLAPEEVHAEVNGRTRSPAVDT